MFLRSRKRIKDGKEHCYYSVEESRRLQSGKVTQRRVLYLGESNDSQQTAWRKTRDTLRGFLEKIESLNGQARRVWLMDRGIPTAAVLAEMRDPGRKMFYLVGTPRE